MPVKGGNACLQQLVLQTVSIIEGQDRAGNGGVRAHWESQDYHDPINKLIDHTEGSIQQMIICITGGKTAEFLHLYGGERVVFVGDAAHHGSHSRTRKVKINANPDYLLNFILQR